MSSDLTNIQSNKEYRIFIMLLIMDQSVYGWNVLYIYL